MGRALSERHARFQLTCHPGLRSCLSEGEAEWFAAFTAPHNERSVVRHLDVYEVETFLPTFETTHVWKNRQKKVMALPLFPSYVFLRIAREQLAVVFRTPGIIRILGGVHGPIPIPSTDIDVLRSESYRGRLEPYCEPLVGEKVRIKDGPMQGVEGTLVRKKNSLRFVLTINLLSQHAALEVGADDVVPVSNHRIVGMQGPRRAY